MLYDINKLSGINPFSDYGYTYIEYCNGCMKPITNSNTNTIYIPQQQSNFCDECKTKFSGDGVSIKKLMKGK